MTIQIQLPDATLAALLTQAQALGRPAEDIAADALAALFTDDADMSYPPDSDTLARLRQGFADMEAGNTLSIAEAQMALHTAFNDRYSAQPPSAS